LANFRCNGESLDQTALLVVNKGPISNVRCIQLPVTKQRY